VKIKGHRDRWDFMLRFIPHRQQRYTTVGDYKDVTFVPNAWEFTISRMSPRKYCWLVFFHEIIEWGICRLTGVKMKAIDKWDMAYEKARAERFSVAPDALVRNPDYAPCGCPWQLEPGDDVHAPYADAHATATLCERAIAKAIGIDWWDYEKAVEALD
jgi:hypothetical protein